MALLCHDFSGAKVALPSLFPVASSNQGTCLLHYPTFNTHTLKITWILLNSFLHQIENPHTTRAEADHSCPDSLPINIAILGLLHIFNFQGQGSLCISQSQFELDKASSLSLQLQDRNSNAGVFKAYLWVAEAFQQIVI